MWKKILVATRGGMAHRILRTTKALGIESVLVHSDVDRGAAYLRLADHTVCIGPAAASMSYLNSAAILAAAELSRVEAIHPGEGDFAENAAFAHQARAIGFAFIGAPTQVLRALSGDGGLKSLLKTVGLPLIPGSVAPAPRSVEGALVQAKKMGYPVCFKKSSIEPQAGYIVDTEAALKNAFLRHEAEGGGGSLEKHLHGARHISIAVLMDQFGHGICLGDIESSLRYHETPFIQEAPAVGIANRAVARMGERCLEAAHRLGFYGVGCFDFLYHQETFYFHRLRAHLPREHALYEMVCGLDLVAEQIRLALGEKLRFRQRDLLFRGHAIQYSLRAEDTERFAPSLGLLQGLDFPAGAGVRIDADRERGEEIRADYAPAIAKITVHGENRDYALARLRVALAETRVEGVKTNLPLHRRLVHDTDFIRGGMSAHTLERKLAFLGQRG